MNKKTKIILIAVASLLAVGIVLALIFLKPGKTDGSQSSAQSTTSAVQKEETDSGDKTGTTSSANTESGKKPTVGVENVTTERGKTVKVPVIINDNPGITASAIKIEYDGSKLTYIGYDEGEVFKNYFFKEDKNAVLFSNVENGDSTKNGVMFYLKFKVKDDAKIGETDIKVNATDESFINFDEQFIKANVSKGTVTIK